MTEYVGGLVCTVGDVDMDEWFFDSGATSHMARSKADFRGKQNMSHEVGTAKNASMRVTAKGVVNLDCVEGTVDVQEVSEVPDLATNLLSISKICGFKVVFSAFDCKVLDEDGEVFVSGTADNGLYRLNRQNQRTFLSSEMWHRRLRHLNSQSLKKLQSIADGIQFKGSDELNCVTCIQGKHARDYFRAK